MSVIKSSILFSFSIVDVPDLLNLNVVLVLTLLFPLNGFLSGFCLVISLSDLFLSVSVSLILLSVPLFYILSSLNVSFLSVSVSIFLSCLFCLKK